MVEYLAIPAWNTPPRSIEAWIESFGEAGGSIKVDREEANHWWIEDKALKVRGYVLIEAGFPAAINFEFMDDEPAHALAVVTAAAHAVGWEIHADDDDDEDRDLIDEVD